MNIEKLKKLLQNGLPCRDVEDVTSSESPFNEGLVVKALIIMTQDPENARYVAMLVYEQTEEQVATEMIEKILGDEK